MLRLPKVFFGILLPILYLLHQSGHGQSIEKPWSITEMGRLVKQAPCTKKAPYSDIELEQWFNHFKKTSTIRTNENVHGITLKNEHPEIIKWLKQLTSEFLYAWENPTVSEGYNFKSTCITAICAAKEIFGPKQGLRLLYLIGRFGLNGSTLAFPQNDPSAWTTSELDTIILAASDLPDGIFLNSNKQIIHQKREKKEVASKNMTKANAKVEVFSLWDYLEPLNDLHEMQRMVLFHEFCHILSKDYFDATTEWLNFSLWRKKSFGEDKEMEKIAFQFGLEWEKISSNVISLYAEANPREDFAESCTAYRYNGQSFKELFPDKYTYLKYVVFDGVEFLTHSSCNLPVRNSTIVSRQSIENLKRINFDTESIEMFKTCGSSIVDIFFQINSYTSNIDIKKFEAKNCLHKEVANITYKKTFSELFPNYASYKDEIYYPKAHIKLFPAEEIDFLWNSAINQLKKSIVKGIEDVEASKSYLYNSLNNPNSEFHNKDKFCNEWSYLGYFYMKDAFADFITEEISSFNYKYRKDIDAFLLKLCKKVQIEGNISRLEPEAISLFVENFFS